MYSANQNLHIRKIAVIDSLLSHIRLRGLPNGSEFGILFYRTYIFPFPLRPPKRISLNVVVRDSKAIYRNIDKFPSLVRHHFPGYAVAYPFVP